ncbi:helix-turn-helix domain-containing protein [Micromonospora yangpuensis]|uniref:Helix-turn-helix domain-containing protein n=1 Tax=Micromonospora yangpuensis TaxID=683228 RepID=A0A1C6U4A2_9ACTN|nr:helix-turn-helix domain-containing protein [Micromonospora yangpuensis]GGL93176.1 hypothetical protein GCM10012279_08640 [Micromonospora yangpuensis]SCL48699.1 Helix-turn-helix domain-containing protein [Micromonospora yangpuensis]
MRSTGRTRRTTPATTEPDATRAWTAEQIRDLGTSTDLATAAAMLGISLSAAYKLIRRDAFPVPHLRVGAQYRIPTAPLLAALHLLEPAPPTTAPDGHPPAT